MKFKRCVPAALLVYSERIMNTDFHNHSLFGIDDGASSPDESIKMLKMLHDQNVDRVVLTPHYFAEQSPVSFIRARKESFDLIKHSLPKRLQIHLGAEVALTNKITTEVDLSLLTISKTNRIMISLPFFSFEDWIDQELHNILYIHHLFPIFTSMERYAITYPRDKYEKLLLTPGAAFQFNSKSLTSDSVIQTINALISKNKTVLFAQMHTIRLQESPTFKASQRLYQADSTRFIPLI